MARVVILGAGLTGLSAAYHLEQQGIFDYKIFEKNSSAGGSCAPFLKMVLPLILPAIYCTSATITLKAF